VLVDRDGFEEVHQPSELVQVITRNWGGEFKVLYVPLGGEQILHFEAVNEIVRKAGDMIYAVDEVDKFQSPAFAPPQLYELINYARHFHVAMIGTARRPAQVSKEYTFGLSEICSFNVTEPGDLDYFEKKIGHSGVLSLPSLGQYEYLRWMQDGRLSTGKGWK
jgi:hypothetical protein